LFSNDTKIFRLFRNLQAKSTYEPAYELDREPVDRYRRSYSPKDNRLYNPNNNRPVELSWLQQNNYQHNHHHHHQHHHHHYVPKQIPIAINRWSNDDDDKQMSNKNTKTFIDEYIRQ